MRARDFVEKIARIALLWGAALVLVGVVNRWELGRMPWDAPFALWSALAAVAVAVIWTFARRLSLRAVARIVDTRGGTRDRFLTALTFEEKGGASEMRALVMQECAAFFAGRDFRSAIPVPMPREVAWLLVPATALLMLQWNARDESALRLARESAGQAEVAPTVAKLEQLAREAEERAAETDDAELRKLAEKMKRSAAQLRAEATTKENAAKAALAELSTLEQLVKELQKPPSEVSSDELKQLAKELAKIDATRDAATAIEAGRLADAAQALDEAAKQEEPSAENAAQSLKQALERLAQQRQLSEGLQKLSQEMGSGQRASEALQKLAQMLRQMPQAKQGSKPQPGNTRSPQSLLELLAALQNLKYGGDGEGKGQPSDGKPGEGKGKVAMLSFAKPGEGNPQSGDAQMPTGMPGGEHDTGTTETPFGKQGSADEKGTEAALKGQLGEGESLSMAMPAAPDGSKASLRYKELYDAMAPAAQEAVMQEEIPLGSRFFIKRYFESIRPE